jgi:uncharacterized protein YdhG (YjbR/CyaY superfamily)
MTMARTKFSSVDEYIGSQPQAVQRVLKQVRSAVRKSLPGAEEVISYNIPAYKRQGERVLFFAGFQRHYSVYPATKRLIEEFKSEPGAHEFKSSTIRFPLSEPVPVKFIERVAKFRAKEAAERVKAKMAAAKKR